ncbi:UDP-glycosyltransferase 708D1-like [Abrus precatorius]|uniref:Glycosyltransferase n=1 Tax=Abrus precatorius TaxID=3816 RepID=A0A8B8LUG5_ABRPR|nr:UDP-glycosyltransferase 708D1-like [Abrus precatorius]
MSDSESVVHLAFLPSAGMGHLNPCLRTASLFLRKGCRVTLITPKPTVSLAESNLISRFCSSFPNQVTQMDLNLVPLDDPENVNTNDPFWLQFETIRRSVHLVAPILSSLSPTLSAFIFDVSLISPLVPIIEKLSCPSYIYFIAPARMFSFFAYLSVLAASNPGAKPFSFIGDVIKIPGIASPIPRSSVPPLLLQPNSLFESILMEDSPKLTKLNGVFINTFEQIEPEALAALNEGKVVKGLPPAYGVGPLMVGEFEKVDQGDGGCMSSIMKWLDGHAKGSVVYICLGNKTAIRRQQIKDVALGLIECGYSFLWVVKLKVVDREEEEEDLEDVLGSELINKVREKGIVVKEFVNQMEILGHHAVGGFLSHGGWNSLVEAVWQGVPILSWAQFGDQKIGSEAMRDVGVGVLPEEWGWGGHEVVKSKDFAKEIKEMMGNESLRSQVREMQKVARKAAGVGGSCEVIVKKLIEEWKKNA